MQPSLTCGAGPFPREVPPFRIDPTLGRRKAPERWSEGLYPVQGVLMIHHNCLSIHASKIRCGSEMKRDPLKQFVVLRESLLSRQAELQAELKGINEALGVAGVAVAAVAAAPAVTGKRRGRAPGTRGGGRRAKNSISLKEAVLTVTKAKPLAKPEILSAVAKLGYKFAAKDPMNSLNTLLYTDKQIKNHGGKFGPA